jgi:uncharacterized protein YbjT (DUF2867 family)
MEQSLPESGYPGEKASDMNTASILVLGAGELGMPVLRNLAKRLDSSSGATVTVLLRRSSIDPEAPSKQKDIAELRSLGVHFLAGDLADPTTDLSALFKGYHTVIGCTGFVTGRGFQLKLAHAVLEADVKRYFPWQFGVDYDLIGRGSAQDLFDEQLDVRDLLRSQHRTEWVIVSTGMFTSFLFEPSFGVVDLAQNSVHALGSWDTAVTVTTPEDIGALTAEICFAEPRIVNSIVYTAGDTLTYARLADIVDSVLGRELGRVEWSLPELKDELAKDPANAI